MRNQDIMDISEPFRVVIDREKMERRYVLQIQSKDGSWKSKAPLSKRDFILKYGFEPEWPHQFSNKQKEDELPKD
jgi:hypothetical protein